MNTSKKRKRERERERERRKNVCKGHSTKP
jgi:hypothetical protein